MIQYDRKDRNSHISGGATLAFTDFETEQLRKALLKETRHCAVTLGMKKTSVDQLTKAVGIAKGSFYKFYESKEMLFFAVLEDIHAELYGVADQVLETLVYGACRELFE